MFRIQDWFYTHLLHVVVCLLAWLYIEKIAFNDASVYFVFILSVGCLSAALGYYTNDVFDVKKDIVAGKSNSALNHSYFKQIILILGLVLLIFVTWKFLSSNNNVLILLCIEIILFFLYSAPFVRFKEIPFLSINIDALYAFVMWGIVVLALIFKDFSFIKNITSIFFLIWLLLVGYRGILSHQIADYYNDLKSNTRTLATKYGTEKLTTINKFLIAPLELFFFIIFLFLTWKPLLIFYFVFIASIFLDKQIKYELNNKRYLKQPLYLSSYFLDYFYYSILPIIFLVLLIFNDFRFLILATLIVLIFYQKIKLIYKTFVIFYTEIILKTGSFIVNYSLYYSFLVFGIDLKKRANERKKRDNTATQIKILNDTLEIISYKTPKILTTINEPNVHGLWIGTKLSNMELLTLLSFIKHGYIFHLWIYEQLETKLPEQVVVCDANEIISKEKIFYYRHKSQFGQGQGSVAGFSDIFRYKLLYEKGGWWVDMDVTCLKPFDSDGEYFFRAHNSLPLVGNVIKAPAKSELMQICYEQALKSIDESNQDWHKPIEILANNVLRLGLSQFIYTNIFNTDEYYKFEKFYFSDVEIPNEWVFIHWNNEILRTYGITKEYSFYESTYTQLLRKYNLLSKEQNHIKLNKLFKRKLFIANLKKIV